MADNRKSFRPRRHGSVRRCLRRGRTIGAALLLGVLATTPAISQELGLKHGHASLDSGNYEAAVRQFSATVNDTDSTEAQIAEALYLRGVAYRRMGNPARAISDIGAAIWLGLSGSDKARALVNKGLAYRAVGLSGQAEAAISQARQSSGGVDAILAQESRVTVANLSSSPLSDGAAGESTWSRIVPSVPSVGDLVPSMPSFGSSSSSSASAPASEPSPEQASQPEQAGTRTAAAAPTTGWGAEVADESASQGSAVSRWFGSLTGDSASPPPPAPGPAASTSPTTTTSPTPKTVERTTAAPPPSAESWAANTSAQREGESGTAIGRWFSRQTNSAPAQPSAAPQSGGYTVQLANSQSPGDAQALWKKAKASNPQLASTTSRIEKVDIGDFGTFYTVKIGPYATSAESTKVCNALKRGGTDCSVVAPDGP